jgi:GxxExxY protein
MNTDQAREKLLHGELTEKIIGLFYDVYNELGSGFLESVYQRAFLIALEEAGLHSEIEFPIPVHFRSQNVGSFYADISVEKKVILELKVARGIEPIHEAQLLNYLRATDIELGLVFNFGTRAQFRRLRMDNKLKGVKPLQNFGSESDTSVTTEAVLSE